MDFDNEGKRIVKTSQVSLLIPKKRGRGRPRKYITETNNEAATELNTVSSQLPKKRGRGRPRKFATETNKQTKRKFHEANDVKMKLRLLESVMKVYEEIKKIDNENQKNIRKFHSLINNLD